MRDVILTCALTGNITRPDATPHLPVTPSEIAESALEAERAGAAIVHIHVRHPDDGRPSMELSHYVETVEHIRAAGSNLILNITTGPGGRFVPSDADPKIAGPGTTLLPPQQRVSHIAPLKPEIATLDLNTMNSGDQVVINTPRNTRVMGDAILSAGAKPEIEIFNPGDLVLARKLIDEDPRFGLRPMFSFVLGIAYGWPASIEAIQLGVSMLPPGAIWTAFGVSRHSFPMVAASVLMGGHARVGMEDNIYLSRGELARSNAQLCDKARRIIEDLGCRVASPDSAREMLGL
jgi:uncharacterized protein (DUF849 family)